MRFRLIGAACVAAAIAYPVAANATIIDITYTGIITDGSVFNVACEEQNTCNLAGQPFTLSYTFDTTGGVLNNGTLTGSLSNPTILNPNPVNTFAGSSGATFGQSILPASCNIPGCLSNEVDSPGYQSVSMSFDMADSESVSTQLFPNPDIPSDITQSFALSGPDIGTGTFSGEATPGNLCNSLFCGQGDLLIQSVTVTDAIIAATPIPSTSLLFLSGMAFIGLLTKRRRLTQHGY